MENLRLLLAQKFDRFTEELKTKYHFGDADWPGYSDEGKLRNEGCNPFMETEADYKVKLGGFLERELFPQGYTIHSELGRVYGGSGSGQKQYPDLSIHQGDAPWLDDDTRLRSLRCVIEIKGANIKKPYQAFRNTGNSVFSDIEKLKNLNLDTNIKVLKCLVFLDEACKVGKPVRGAAQDRVDEWIHTLRSTASGSGIIILSNNPVLHMPKSE